MRQFLSRLPAKVGKILLDFVWMGFGLYVILTSGTNTPDPTARAIWYALGLAVLGTGFIRFLSHLWGDDTEKALEKILEQQTEMQKELHQLRTLIEQKDLQK